MATVGGGLLAPGLDPLAPSRTAWRSSGSVRGASPVTVAGPRRTCTGFPEPPTLNGRNVTVGGTMTVNLTRIYTRLGDDGETHLGDMSRVPKTHPRIEAYGTVDELNAQLGVALALPDVPERFAGVPAADPERPVRRRRRHLRPPRRRPHAAAAGARADRVARAGVRRGQRRARAAEVVRPPRRHARRRPAARRAARSAGAPSGARSTAATTSTASACATSTASPTCSSSSRARRTPATSRCGSPAATAEPPRKRPEPTRQALVAPDEGVEQVRLVLRARGRWRPAARSPRPACGRRCGPGRAGSCRCRRTRASARRRRSAGSRRSPGVSRFAPTIWLVCAWSAVTTTSVLRVARW